MYPNSNACGDPVLFGFHGKKSVYLKLRRLWWFIPSILVLAPVFIHDFDSQSKSALATKSTAEQQSSAAGQPFLKFPNEYTVSCGPRSLWRGYLNDVLGDKETVLGDREISLKVSIVISHCARALDWFEDATSSLDVRSVTVYSKCGKPVVGAPANARIIQLPNVGRCDHSFAYHMNTLGGAKGMESESVVLSVKDTFTSPHHADLEHRDLTEVVAEASGPAGFSCGKLPNYTLTFDKTKPFRKAWFDTIFNHGAEWSFWHDVSEISKFTLDSYVSYGWYHNELNEENKKLFSVSEVPTFEMWWKMLGAPELDKIMPVCYSGFFAAQKRNIMYAAPALARMQHMLERGDNIIEGHYAERSFAALLLPQLPANITEQILCLANAFRRCKGSAGYCGILYGCHSDRRCAHHRLTR